MPKQPCFLDTNVLLRLFTRDDEKRSPGALALLTRVEHGEEKVITSPLVIFEAVFTLQKRYEVPRQQIQELLVSIISLRGVQLAGKGVFYRAFEIYTKHNLSFADAYNAAYMEAEEITDIYTWDMDFDKLPGLVRLEPSA